MRHALIIGLSLLILSGLKPNKYIRSPAFHVPAYVRACWFKKNRKEALRDEAGVNLIAQAIHNSLRFVSVAPAFKLLPF